MGSGFKTRDLLDSSRLSHITVFVEWGGKHLLTSDSSEVADTTGETRILVHSRLSLSAKTCRRSETERSGASPKPDIVVWKSSVSGQTVPNNFIRWPGEGILIALTLSDDLSCIKPRFSPLPRLFVTRPHPDAVGRTVFCVTTSHQSQKPNPGAPFGSLAIIYSKRSHDPTN